MLCQRKKNTAAAQCDTVVTQPGHCWDKVLPVVFLLALRVQQNELLNLWCWVSPGDRVSVPLSVSSSRPLHRKLPMQLWCHKRSIKVVSYTHRRTSVSSGAGGDSIWQIRLFCLSGFEELQSGSRRHRVRRQSLILLLCVVFNRSMGHYVCAQVPARILLLMLQCNCCSMRGRTWCETVSMNVLIFNT